MKKKVLSLVFAIMCMYLLGSVSVNAMTHSEFDAKLSELQNTYYHGYQWTGSFDGGSQCYGYANMISYNIFGQSAKYWTKSYDLSGVKAGDVIQYGNTTGSGHTIFVTNVSGDTITYTDCNSDWNCTVKWNQTVSKSSNKMWSYSFSYRCIAPELDTDTQAPTVSNMRISNSTDSNFTISADLNDNVGVTRVWLNIYGPNGQNGYEVSASNGTFVHTINMADYGGFGEFSVHMYAFDAADNQTRSAIDNFYPAANLGNDFYAVILHKDSWKPITYDTDGFVRLSTEVGSANQVWKFTRQSDGSYTIASTKNNWLLEMTLGDTTNGKQVSVGGKDWGGNYQRWYLFEYGGGYLIQSKHYMDLNRVLHLDNGNTNDGTAILSYEKNYNRHQVFAVYAGEEIKLKGPELNITKEGNTTTFNWSNTYGESAFDLHILKNGEKYKSIRRLTGEPCSYSDTLPNGEYSAYVQSINAYYGVNGNTVSFSVNNDILTADTIIISSEDLYQVNTQISNLSQSAIYTVAMYTADGELIDVKTQPIDSGTTEASANLTKNENASYIKVYLWDNLNSMKPLVECEKIMV